MNDIQLPAYSDAKLAELSPSKLTDILIEERDRITRNVIAACASRGDEMTAYLRQLHEDDFLWNDDEDLPDEIAEGKWWLRHHASMILGLIPTEQAGLLLVELMRRMSREEDEDLQDWLAGYWPALFLNKPDSVLPVLHALCEDRGVDWYMRANAIDTIVAAAARQGSDALEQALEWLAGLVSDESEDWELRLLAGNKLLDYPRAAYRSLLENLADRQSGLGRHFDRKDIKQAYSDSAQHPDRFTDPWKFYKPEAIAQRQIRWREEDEREMQRALNGDEDYPDAPYDPPYDHEPYIRPEPKTGRNDPCPCGSGKKYKQCCLKTQQAQPGDDFLWRRIRRAIEGSPAQLLGFGSSHFGQEAMLEAWDEFMPFDDEPFAPDTPHMPIFMPWFFFDWLPDPDDTSVKPAARDGRTLARAFLDKKGKQLDPLHARYLEQCCAAPFSFYDVLSVRPGAGFTLRDIFTGEEADVTEQSGSQHMQTGDIMFAKLARIDQVTMLEASAPIMFPPVEKSAILELRKKMLRRNPAPTHEVLKEFFYDMLDIYHDITDRLLNPPMPQLRNTDGEPMVFNKLIYDLDCSPREALDILKRLNITEDDESILTGAEFDPTGELRKIAFAWEKPGNEKHKNWGNTILGHLTIADGSLSAEVNSENRAQQFKALMEKLLPGKARYKTTVIQSPQSMLARMKKEGDTAQARQRREEHDELNNRPEVKALIAEHLRQHYRNWPEEKLPALNGKTPLQAVKTRDGREMVEALLLDIERRSRDGNMPLPSGLIAELRERLGLA